MTESSRANAFLGTDQTEWQRRSGLSIEAITTMLREHRSLFDIYEFARQERKKIADELGQQPSDKSRFGEIRVFKNPPGLLRMEGCSDYYARNVFASMHNSDDTLFSSIAGLIKPQLAAFKCVPALKAFSFDQRVYIPDQSKRFDIYTSDERTSELMLNAVVRTEIATNRQYLDLVNIQYPDMDEHIYQFHLQLFGLYLEQLMRPGITGDHAIFRIGLLAYDLSSDNLLDRGSAAVNGWALRAMIAEKNMLVTDLRIHSLPFDVCAHMLRNKVQYAVAFAKTVKNDFVLTDEIRFTTWAERNLAGLLMQVIRLSAKLPQHESLSSGLGLFTQSHANVGGLIQDLTKMTVAMSSYLDALKAFQEKLLPYVGVNPIAGEQFAQELYPIADYINKEIRELQQAQFNRPR